MLSWWDRLHMPLQWSVKLSRMKREVTFPWCFKRHIQNTFTKHHIFITFSNQTFLMVTGKKCWFSICYKTDTVCFLLSNKCYWQPCVIHSSTHHCCHPIFILYFLAAIVSFLLTILHIKYIRQQWIKQSFLFWFTGYLVSFSFL